MLKNILILFCVALLFQACSVPTSNFNINKNEKVLEFKIKDESPLKIGMESLKVTPNFDRCVAFSDTLQSDTIYGKIFVENINLDSNCYFNQDSNWAFLSEFRDNLKLKSFEKVEQKSFEGYDFYTFRVNKNEYVSFIFLSLVNKYTFIVDYKGEFSQEIISKIDKDYQSKYLKSPRFEADYNYSLVRFNFFKRYFEGSSEDNFSSR